MDNVKKQLATVTHFIAKVWMFHVIFLLSIYTTT